jgi:hypothetical protein
VGTIIVETLVENILNHGAIPLLMEKPKNFAMYQNAVSRIL